MQRGWADVWRRSRAAAVGAGPDRRSAERGFHLIVTLNDLPDLTIRPLYLNPGVAAAQTAYIVSRYRDEPAILALCDRRSVRWPTLKHPRERNGGGGIGAMAGRPG